MPIQYLHQYRLIVKGTDLIQWWLLFWRQMYEFQFNSSGAAPEYSVNTIIEYAG